MIELDKAMGATNPGPCNNCPVCKGRKHTQVDTKRVQDIIRKAFLDVTIDSLPWNTVRDNFKDLLTSVGINGNYKSRNGHCIIMQLLQADLLLVDWCKEEKGLVLKPNRDYYVNDWNA